MVVTYQSGTEVNSKKHLTYKQVVAKTEPELEHHGTVLREFTLPLPPPPHLVFSIYFPPQRSHC